MNGVPSGDTNICKDLKQHFLNGGSGPLVGHETKLMCHDQNFKHNKVE